MAMLRLARGGIALALVAVPLLGAIADDASDHVTVIGPIKVEHAWARASRGPDGQVFMTLHNEGGADRLLEARTDAAESVEIHGFVMVAGKPASRPLGPVALAAGQELELEPNGIFLKLTGLKRPLVKGEEIELEVVFEHAGAGAVHVEIEAADAKQHSHAGHRH